MMRRIVCLLLCLLLAAVGAVADTLDLTDRGRVTEGQINGLIKELSEIAPGTEVDLTGVEIAAKDKAQLVTALPQLHFLWNVTLGDLVIPGDTQVLDLDALTTQRFTCKPLLWALTSLQQLTHVTMFEQALSVKDMELLMAQLPNVTFDWTVRIDNYRIRTDATAFSTLKGRQEPRYTVKQLDALKYCTKLEAIDLGHNNVSDLSFLTNWPHLKVLIIIDSKRHVTDLSPLAELNELEYVELFMQEITDLTPLANKPALKDLNLCHNSITDITPLMTDTNLERLWISYNPKLPQEQIDAFKAAVPGCRVETEVYGSTDAGWREHDHYFRMMEGFQTMTYIPLDGEGSE